MKLPLALVALAALAALPRALPAPQVTSSLPHPANRVAELLTDWTRPVFPRGEYVARRATALAALTNREILLIPGAEGTSTGETFRQLDDFEYFVGLEVPRSLLVVDGRTRQSILFVPATDLRFENPGRPNDFPGRPLATERAVRDLSGVDSVFDAYGIGEFLAAASASGVHALVDLGGAGRRAGEETSMFGVPTPEETLATYLHKSFPSMEVHNAYAAVARLRMTKSAGEVDVMRRAARATSMAIASGASRVRPGIDERTLTGAFAADCAASGSQRVAFTPIIKSGVNSLWPWRILGAHYDRRNRSMQAGEMVIYDVGCEVDHYVSDVGRTFPVATAFTARQRELVDMVRRISDAVIAEAKPGITLRDLQRVADAAIPASAKPYMQAPFYFGHHLGLDTSDPFLQEAPLAPGMIFTIEPWYYNHDQNVAAFIEDEILITPSGSENLTAALPRDAAGLEALRRVGQKRRP